MISLPKPPDPRKAKNAAAELPATPVLALPAPLSWSPFTAGPYVVPVTRWVE